MRILSLIAALAMSLTMTGALLAADDSPASGGKHGDGQHRHGMGMGMGIGERIDRLVQGLDLTAEQKTKVEALKKEYAPKTGDFRKKMNDILTADQKKARDDAMKAAKDAGKNGMEVWQAGHKAVKLTDEQKQKVSQLFSQVGPAAKDVREKVGAILTPEQKEKLKAKLEQWRKDHPRHGSEQ
jgi:Spy/CpxP family protein refolding chaperone